MKGSSHFPIRKKCPIGYQGRKCLVACCTCDADWLESFLVQLKDVLYASDPENLECELWKKKKCLYMFISFPYGDSPLVWFIMAGMNLICMDWKGSPMNAKHLKRVEPKSELMAIHNGMDWMMNAYTKKEYNRVAQLSNLVIPNTCGFFMFMSVLNAYALSHTAKEDMKEVIALGADKYVAFHRQHNGTDSQEYAYALLLRSYCTRDNGTDLDTAALLLPKEKPLVFFLYGTRYFWAKNFEEASKCFFWGDPGRWNLAATAFAKAKLWHYAHRFAALYAKDHDDCKENMLILARSAHVLGKRTLATKILRRTKETGIMKDWTMADYRVCDACAKVLKGKMKTCRFCQEAFYCNDECCRQDYKRHVRTGCRCCRFCYADLSGPDKRRLRCSGCYVAVYCSAECQLRDWEERHHESVCK